jgi:phage terminase small subunit
MEEPTSEALYEACSENERKFIDYYVIRPNKTQAAIAAGMSRKTAAQIGFVIYHRPQVKAAIEAILKAKTLTMHEVLKIVSDTVQSNMTDYYDMKKEPIVPRVKVGLAKVILSLEMEILQEQEFFQYRVFDEEETRAHNFKIKSYQDRIAKLKIKLKHNKKATAIVDGDIIMIDKPVLNMARLIADKEKGKVKKIKYGKDGLEVELCSPEAAQDKLLRVHGAYEKDNSQVKAEIVINIDGLDAKLGDE